MKLTPSQSFNNIALLVNARVLGDEEMIVTGINEIHRVEKGDLTFVDHPKYYDKALNSAASFIIINKEVPVPPGKALLFSDDPFRDYVFLCKHFMPFEFSREAIHHTVEIGEGTIIQPNVSIGPYAKIGNHCIIHSGVVIYDHSIIGDHVVIHANTTLGSDAFYFKRRPEFYDKMHSCGRVVIKDNVEIGSGCTVDRGVSSDTTIGEGTKMDNQVHIGHDTIVGKNCLFAAQVGVAGCVIIEDNVILWGQVGVQKDLTIGAGAVVLGQSGVGKSLAGGKTYFGSPTRDARDKMKELALIKRLPEIVEKLH